NLGVLMATQRNLTKSEEYYRRAIATGMAPLRSYTNLASSLFSQGRRPEAWHVLAVGDSAFPGNALLTEWYARLLASAGQLDSAAKLQQAIIEQRPNDFAARSFASMLLGAVATTRGRLREAQKWNDELATANTHSGVQQAALIQATNVATARIWFLGDRSAIAALDRAVAAQPIEKLPAGARPYIAVATAYAMAGRADGVRMLIASFEHERHSVTQISDDVVYHSLQGLLAFAERRYVDAAREMQASSVGQCITCALPIIAQSLDLASKPDSAIATFEQYLKTNDA